MDGGIGDLDGGIGDLDGGVGDLDGAVSYKHVALPTKREVEVSERGETLTKKNNVEKKE